MLRLPVIKRRLIQWSLRSFFVALIGLAVGFSYLGAKVRRESRITKAVRLIEASPGWFRADEYDPIPLIRAVNALQAIGKEDAIEALRRFAKNNSSHGPPDELQEHMRLIIPLLFDRVDPEDRFPSVYASDPPGTPYRLEVREWLTADLLSVVGDIPFNCSNIAGFSGAMEDFSYAIDWAQRHARFRSTPLRPVDDPFGAADQLLIELRRAANGHGGTGEVSVHVKRQIREQVVKAIGHLLPPGESDRFLYSMNWDVRRGDFNESYRAVSEDTNWVNLKEKCEPLGIRWSSDEQAYVTTKP
jgi:hypothetical protein